LSPACVPPDSSRWPGLHCPAGHRHRNAHGQLVPQDPYRPAIGDAVRGDHVTGGTMAARRSWTPCCSPTPPNVPGADTPAGTATRSSSPDWSGIPRAQHPSPRASLRSSRRTRTRPDGGKGARGSQPHPGRLIHTDRWAGSRARLTALARSSRTESRSTVSCSRAANAATVLSAS
jgi:hypothetical protein